MNCILEYHHIPTEMKSLISDLYTGFQTSVTTSSYSTPFIPIERGVLQGDCLSPLLFNMIFSTFINSIESKEFEQLGYRYSQHLSPRHWYQFADDAAIITGQQYENQILLNAFTRWTKWANMIIRVDKCKTFGIQKVNTASVKYSPKLATNDAVIPPVRMNEGFTYLGRVFDFHMDNDAHKTSLVEKCKRILEDIDRLPLHPKHKIQLYSKFLMSKINWDLTISDINITWVKQTLDSISSSFVRKWLEIPINSTLDIVTLSKEKFGLNVIKVSTKYLQCQTTKRNCLKKSPNPDINYLHQATSQESIQVDQYKDTSDVTKSVRAKQIEKISNDLQYQGYIVKQMWTLSNEQLKKLWIDVRDILPSNIYNFTNRYMSNTLATLKNMVLWGKATMDTCLACKENSQSLLHVVSGCKVHLQQGRYTWRHKSILATLLSSIDGLRGLRIFADIPGYPCPTVVTGTLKRPDVVIVYQEKIVIVLELTCGFITNVKENCARKIGKYNSTIVDLKKQFEKVTFVNLSMSALGLICRDDNGNGIMQALKSIGLSELQSKKHY